jgi:integrase
MASPIALGFGSSLVCRGDWLPGWYLTTWLTTFAKQRVRPNTYANYDAYVRGYLIPGLGNRKLGTLSVKHVRAYVESLRQICQCCARGWDARRNPNNRNPDKRPRCCSVGRCCNRTVQPSTVRYIRAVLSAALAHGVREELLFRNVASVVRLHSQRSAKFTPFTVR